MGRFDKVAKIINDVANESKVRANDKKVIWINDEDLIDHPDNNENITKIDDIVEMIKSQGFRYELTVTTYNMPPGKYQIVSGHRRRAAARVCGYAEFPCIIQDFSSEADVFEALLSGNASRNADSDPLLYAVRYKQYEKMFDMKGEKKNVEEIAKRLNISVGQADKYNQFNKIIKPFWDMVRAGKIGKDGLYTLSTSPEEVQKDIYDIILEYINKNETISTQETKNIIKAYRDSKDKEQDKKIDIVQDDSETDNSETKTHPRHEGKKEVVIKKEVMKWYMNYVLSVNVKCHIFTGNIKKLEESIHDNYGKSYSTVSSEFKVSHTPQGVYFGNNREDMITYNKLARLLINAFEQGLLNNEKKTQIEGHNSTENAKLASELEKQQKYKEERMSEEDKTIVSKPKKTTNLNAKTVKTYLKVLNTRLEDLNEYADDEDAADTILKFAETIELMRNEARIIAEKYNVSDELEVLRKALYNDIND